MGWGTIYTIDTLRCVTLRGGNATDSSLSVQYRSFLQANARPLTIVALLLSSRKVEEKNFPWPFPGGFGPYTRRSVGCGVWSVSCLVRAISLRCKEKGSGWLDCILMEKNRTRKTTLAPLLRVEFYALLLLCFLVVLFFYSCGCCSLAKASATPRNFGCFAWNQTTKQSRPFANHTKLHHPLSPGETLEQSIFRRHTAAYRISSVYLPDIT